MLATGQLLLTKRQAKLLVKLVNAYHAADPPQLFMVIRSIAGDRLVHPGLQEDVFIGDVDALAEVGLIRSRRLSSGTINFDVTPRGIRAVEMMDKNKRNAGGLTGREVLQVVYGYVGVNGGYLEGFSYAKLAEFFSVHCGLELDSKATEGTSRERFIHVLQSSPSDVQARILRALLERIPEPTATGPTVMQPAEVLRLISRLEGLAVPASTPANASDAVRSALDDAEALLKTRGAPRAVDRVHTALHGYLRNLCEQAGITFDEEDTAQRLLKILATRHPILAQDQAIAEFSSGILGPLVSTVDKINNARNTKSPAHPNEELLSEAEAILVINVVRTLLTYLQAKLS